MNIKAVSFGFITFLASCLAQAAPTLFIHDSSGYLGRVDLENGVVDVIGRTFYVPDGSTYPITVTMTDIAFDSKGILYGLDFNKLYRISLQNAYSDPLGSHNISGANALVFGPDDTLYAASTSSKKLFTIDVSTGLGSPISDIGYTSAGDLAFYDGDSDGSQELYLSSSTNELIKVNISNIPSAEPIGVSIGPIGFSSVYGLATASNDVLYGVAGTNIFSINAETGEGSFVIDYGGQDLRQAYGSSFFLGAPGISPSAITPDPDCPPPQEQQRNNLVLVAHGWKSSPTYWSEEMAQDIAGFVEDWDACAYDWENDADTILPINAWRNAAKYGKSLGYLLYCSGYSNIHFIAHSAGSNLIQTAVQDIEDAFSNPQISCPYPKPEIHMTFIDSYDPGFDNATYGKHAKWSEHFVDDDNLVYPANRELKYSFNYEISDLDSDRGIDPFEDHSWPWQWYLCTIKNSNNPPSECAWGGYVEYLEYGFMNSLEYDMQSSLPSHEYLGEGFHYFPQGDLCILEAGALTECGFTTMDEDVLEPESIYVTTPALPIEVTRSLTGYIHVEPVEPSYDLVIAPRVELKTGSSAWASILFNTKEEFNSINFDFVFNSSALGILSVLFDGDPVFTSEERFSINGTNHSHPIWVGEAIPGLHILTLRLDPMTIDWSAIEIKNISVGMHVIADKRCTPGDVSLGPITYFDGDFNKEQSENHLNTSGDVSLESGSIVMYEAAGSIELNPGFKVNNGGIFGATTKPITCVIVP